ncbi:hypothetical protein SRHO_G00170720 [Serrasalmus rhombeus]
MLVEVEGPNPAPNKQCQYPSAAHPYLKATIESLLAQEFSENTEQEYLLLLDELFVLLTEGALKLNPKKLQLMKREVTFLGSVVKDSMEASLAAFDKPQVANATALKSPDKSKPFLLEADASDTALSAVLLQE